MKTALLLTFLLPGLFLAGCANTPAKIKRVRDALPGCPSCQTDPAKDSLAALAEIIAADPCSSQGRHALGHFVAAWKAQYPAKSGGELRGDPKWQVRFASGQGLYAVEYFDDLVPVWSLRVAGIAQRPREGIGVPLSGFRENRGREAIEKYYPPEAITRAVTAVATVRKLGNGRREIEISLYCPIANSTVVWDGKRWPLAADFSAPWAALLARAGKLSQSAFTDLLTTTPTRQPQLYLMEPYDPNREPLILIHGLMSSPLAWAKVSNELWADEAIRQRYQIWQYLYNTSAPPLYPARLLRAQLRELRPLLDPGLNDPAMRRTTLIAHSMGGLVSKALVVQPKDAFWKAAFTMPPEQLKLQPADRLMLTNAFEWEPEPYIHRIIYCCVPHRGSGWADNVFGQIGRALTAPPSSYSEFYRRIHHDNPGGFTPAYEALGKGRVASIDALSPRQPTLKILSSLPVRTGVRQHSIIGVTDARIPLEDSSDGVVPYWSSHVADAVSEKIVHGNHGCYDSDEALAEMKRILKE